MSATSPELAKQKEDTIYSSLRTEIPSEGLNLQARLVLTEGSQNKPSVLIIHGAARPRTISSTEIDTESIDPLNDLEPLQEYLAKEGISSLIVNARGVGKEHEDRSEGEYYGSSLRDRARDNVNAWEFLKERVDPSKIGVIAGSMGGHVGAIMAADQSISPKFLVELEPAAYPEGADSVPLGSEFSARIRGKEDTIQDSPVFSALREVECPILYAVGDKDTVVQVSRPYFEQIVKEKSGEIFIVKDEGHTLLSKPNDVLYSKISGFINGTFSE